MQHRKGFRAPPKSMAPDPHQKNFQAAVAFHQQGDLAQAKSMYEAILSVSPKHFDALHLSGVIAFQSRRFEDAERFYLKALNVRTNFASLYLNYGNVLKETQRFEEALKTYDKALSLKADYPLAHYNRAVVLQELNRFEEALGSYEKAIAFKADYADAFNNRGLILQDLKLFDDALQSYDAAIALRPDHADAFNNRGALLRELKRYDEALASYREAISINPDYAEAFNNCGFLLNDLRRFDEALANYDKAIQIRPDYAEAYNNRANTMNELRRFDEAGADYDAATSIKPDFADAYWNKGLMLLLRGNFAEGLALYEWRKKKKDRVGDLSSNKPVWSGEEDLAGKTILIHREQGLGDAIQFCRYVPLLSGMGAKVLFAPHKPLGKLTSRLGGACEIVDIGDASLDYDYHCPLLSLPLAFKTNLQNIPNSVPYLAADPTLVRQWNEKIGEAGFKIGICWQGSTGQVDSGRSFSVGAFQSLSQIPGVRLISLHKGEGEAQLRELPEGMKVETLGDDFDSGPAAFLDTAAVMQCCDLVVTSDTAVAHLAGALGVKTWVALKYVPDWRWMLDRQDSPWYPTMRLFRQQADGDWDGVFSQIGRALVEERATNPARFA